MESLGNHFAVVRVEYPLLTNRMSDAQDRTAEHLTTQRSGMDDRADVGRGEEVNDVVFAGFDVDFNLGKAGDVRIRRTVAGGFFFGPPPSARPARPRTRA